MITCLLSPRAALRIASAAFLTLAGTMGFALPGAHAKSAGKLTTLHNLTGTDGASPADMPIKATDGNIYGFTRGGGIAPNDPGVIYKITPAGVYSVIHTLMDDDDETSPRQGIEPRALVQGKDGNLYGVCFTGGAQNDEGVTGGTFFKITLSGTYTKLYDFYTGADEAPENPVALVPGSDGNLYGLTEYGGKGGTDHGAYFRLTTAGKFTELYTFTSSSPAGEDPQMQMTVGKDGSFYGLTTFGGSSGGMGAFGTIFKATQAGVVTVLHPFFTDDFGDNPQDPLAPLVQGADGNLYGTSDSGGKPGKGTIFCYHLNDGSFTTVYEFQGESIDGEDPGALTLGSDGNLYGLTINGFPKDPNSLEPSSGSCFQFVPTTSAFTTLVKLAPPGTGPSNPAGGLVEVNKLVFFGTTKNGGANAQGTIVQLTISPTITSATTASATVGVSFSYAIKATGTVTSYLASGLPAGLSLSSSTGVISGKPTTAGTYKVGIGATNAAGSGTASLTITVKGTIPVITSSTTATATAGTAFSYQITATNSPTSYGASGLPSGLTVSTSTGKITGTPTTAGTYSVTIAAFNAAGHGSATLKLTVKAGPPKITSATTGTATVGTAYSYQIVATNSPTSYGASGLPSGLAISTSTGKITGTPTKAGTYSVTIAAFNAAGHGSAVLTLTVKASTQPVITSSKTASATHGVAFSYQITATNSPTSYGASGLPSGLTVSTSTGKISGTPTKAGSYSVTIAAFNASGHGAATLALTVK